MKFNKEGRIVESVQGVIFYGQKLVKVRYENTQLINDKKELVGSSNLGTCKQIIKSEEFVVLVDYSDRNAILHYPSIFSASELSVSLNNGALVSVNVKDTPQIPQGIESIAKVVAEIPVVAAMNVAGSIPVCNAGPIATSYEVVDLSPHTQGRR